MLDCVLLVVFASVCIFTRVQANMKMAPDMTHKTHDKGPLLISLFKELEHMHAKSA